MPTVRFRLLTPPEYAELSGREKTAYLARLARELQSHADQFREENRRVVNWLRNKVNP